MRAIRYIFPIMAVTLFSCESNTYEDLEEDILFEGPITYNGQIKSIISANCLSCHGSDGISSFRPLGTYAELKDAVQNTDLLDRIQRRDGEQGIMPQTGRMPQGSIDLILQWNTDGLQEN
ncbi:cytochrome c [Flavobacterium sp. MFBS3-15]|uniref:cytochrome c n=1 Tax=Flavobacterium sp. MFBS3-15 TaxID=2989816 RepID=UPI002236696C|nr:cytochrome c [Flavobacterium sp. MFBS3-15]MCW4469768.1 cytochrome c [Flavobacterium sp. MFBS3-15]